MQKFAIVFLMMAASATAQTVLSQDEVNRKKCGKPNFHFNPNLKNCSYCAHGLEYDNTHTCVGTPDVIGKCFGEHHYHALTQECHFCSLGYTFNETSRLCETKL